MIPDDFQIPPAPSPMTPAQKQRIWGRSAVAPEGPDRLLSLMQRLREVREFAAAVDALPEPESCPLHHDVEPAPYPRGEAWLPLSTDDWRVRELIDEIRQGLPDDGSES